MLIGADMRYTEIDFILESEYVLDFLSDAIGTAVI